ncbi:MAG: 30S ribosomal protein S17 [Candidatus Omnitrophica bacterium]|nr:30S ribosomal protein S17 [Candidatus Omnitrophota bacterium]
MAPLHRESKKIRRIGVVVSDRMNKTRVVAIVKVSEHPLYRKKIKRRVKILAHDEGNITRPGDTVSVIQCRPLSRTKRYYIAGIVKEGIRKVSSMEESTNDSAPVNSSGG